MASSPHADGRFVVPVPPRSYAKWFLADDRSLLAADLQQSHKIIRAEQRRGQEHFALPMAPAKGKFEKPLAGAR